MPSLTDQLFTGLDALIVELRKRDPDRLRRELRRLQWVSDEACPFCGCADTGVDQRGLSYVGYCEQCDAEGPPSHTREKARELWKRRTN